MHQRVIINEEGHVTSVPDPASTRFWEPEDPIPQDLVTSAINRRDVLAKAATALASNQTYLALGTPTAGQVAAQVKALTRQVNGLLRAAADLLDTISDT